MPDFNPLQVGEYAAVEAEKPLLIRADLSQVPTIARACESDAFIEAIIGPAGSGKTYGAFISFLLLAMQQQPAPDGTRYVKILAVRNTYELLKNATYKTAEMALGAIPGAKFVPSVPSGHVNFMLPDGTRVDIEIEFLAMDTEDALPKLLGKEFTFGLIDEVSELPEKIVWGMVRRSGRYPSGRRGRPSRKRILMVTNGPRTDHFLYDWYLGTNKERFDTLSIMQGRTYFKLFRQPAALIRPRDKEQWKDPAAWLPNSRAENIANLEGGYSYYYDMLGDAENGDSEIRSYVEGEFAPLKRGELVFPEFSTSRHVIDSPDFELPAGGSIGLTFDFGRTPVCLFWWENPEGRQIIIDEFHSRNSDIQELMVNKVWPAYLHKYKRPYIDWATGDPAGLAKGQGIGISPYEILMGEPFNLPMDPPLLGNRIDSRLDSMRIALKTLVMDGQPMFGVLSRCKGIIEAFSQTYIYENVRGATGVREVPVKTHLESDLADAACYGTLYRAMVTKVNMPRANRSSGRGGRRWRL